jgi:hypothetical protein
MPEETKGPDIDNLMKIILVGVISLAILSSFIFLFSFGKTASLAGEAIDILTEVRSAQIENLTEGEFEERVYCSATVVKSGEERAIFLYNCQ